MKPSEITIRRFKNEDLAAYKKTYDEIFELKFNKVLFFYKHQKNIEKFSVPLIYVAIAQDGSIVGANSFFFEEVVCRNTITPVVQSGNTWVSPEFRGRSIFKSILDFSHDDLVNLGINSVIGFANNSSIHGFHRLGYKSHIKTVDVVLNLIKVHFLKAKLIKTAEIIPFLPRLLKSPSRSERVFRSNLEAVCDVICKYDIGNGEIRVHKSLKYLAYKYKDHPLHRYRQYTVETMEGGKACFIVRIDKYKRIFRWGQIVEFGCEPNCHLSECIEILAKFLINDNFVGISYWTTDKTAEKMLCGYEQKSAKSIHFVVKDLSPESKLSTAKWDYFCGDADTA